MTCNQLLTKWKYYNFNIPPKYSDRERYTLYAGHENGYELVAKLFFKEMESVVTELLAVNGLELVELKYNWFTASGFVKDVKTGEYGYFSISDVRFSRDGWFNNVLIRTAKNGTDYTGGCNHYTDLEHIGKNFADILEREYNRKNRS